MSSMATPEVVNLISPSQLGVGELIIYEFVADGQWRWSMGTITSLSTATADLDGGEVTCPPSAGWVVGLRDWTIAPSNVPATAPPPSSAERTSKAKAAAASGDPTPVGQDAFSGTTIKESTVLEIAWDMLDNSKAEEWETLLRLPLSELHRASRTAVILVLQLMGQLPLNRSFEQCWTDNGDTHATAATQWKKAVACLLQPEFSDELARFTLLQNPSHANGPATAAPAKLRQRRVDAVRNAILRERNFTYKAAQSASELTGRLYKWLVGQIRLFDAAAKRRANRSSSSRQGGGLDLNKTTMFFEESDATTSTLRSAIICVLELSTSIHDQRRVGISKAHLARIHSLAFQQRRAVGAGDGKETLIQMSEDYEKVIDVLRLSLRSKHDGRIRAAEELRSAWNAAQASREACNRTVEQLLRSIETASEYLTCDDGEVSRAPSCAGLSRPETVNPSIYSQSSRITSGARLATVTHKLNPYARRSCASTSIGGGEESTMGPRGLPPAFVGNQREGSRSSWLAGTTGAAAGRVSRSAPSTLDSCDLTAVEDMHQRMVLRLQRAVAELDCTVEGLDTQIEALESAGMPDDDSNRAKKLAIVQKQRDSVRQDRDDKAKQLQQLELLLDAVRRIAISA